jgi:hypothetical protein
MNTALMLPSTERPLADAPLIVSYGVGVDSTAMLIEMAARGIRPDLILFADTGAEKPETYAFIPIMNAWLKRVGFPEITIVRYVPKRAPYHTLEGKCLANETLPSLAFNAQHHSCSQVFKIEPQDKFVRNWLPARDAWAGGGKVVKAIGYDDSQADRKRSKRACVRAIKAAQRGDRNAKRYHYWYPLQEWGVTRDQCILSIKKSGLPVPMKSACFFCPASKVEEVVWLKQNHPDLYARAVAMENRARDGKHGLHKIKGLGMSAWAWGELEDGIDPTTIKQKDVLMP